MEFYGIYSRGAHKGISGFTKARQINIQGDTLYPVKYLHQIWAPYIRPPVKDKGSD